MENLSIPVKLTIPNSWITLKTLKRYVEVIVLVSWVHIRNKERDKIMFIDSLSHETKFVPCQEHYQGGKVTNKCFD